MAIYINSGLPLQKHFLAVHACSHASSESSQRTKVLIGAFTPYQIGEKAAAFARKRHFLEESNVAHGAPKSVVDVCMHKFACTNVTQNREIEPIL